ncbi:methyltransferase family protein [Patescibacteria group bacterium]
MIKPKTLILGTIFCLILWFVFPLFFVLIGDYLNLEVINNFYIKIVGLVLMIVALFVFLYLLVIFKIYGKGTPVPIEPPKELVIKGLFKYTRNPFYLCHFIMITGQFLLFGKILLLVYLMLLIIIFNIYVIKQEESQLKKRYGDKYLKYIKTVPRWF